MDRKAARRRRDLDGRNAIVTRITAALPLDFTRLYCCPCHDQGLGLASSVRGVCQKKSLGFYWPVVGAHWYVLVFFGLIGSR